MKLIDLGIPLNNMANYSRLDEAAKRQLGYRRWEYVLHSVLSQIPRRYKEVSNTTCMLLV